MEKIKNILRRAFTSDGVHMPIGWLIVFIAAIAIAAMCSR